MGGERSVPAPRRVSDDGRGVGLLSSGLSRAGGGSRLYEALFAALVDEPIERVVAGVTLPNPASMALHERFGFRRVGVFTRVGRKFDRFWDVAWLERPLYLETKPDG